MSNEVYAIIPARAGSKGVPNKNIKLLAGYPLLAWSIAAAKLSKHITRIIVSTDSEEYAEIARQYGAEVPFLRPRAIATDNAQDIGFIMHTLLWLAEHENSVPDMLVHLRPTSPLRDPTYIDAAIELIREHPEATSLCSAHEVAHPPCKYFQMNADGTFSGLMGEQYISLPRQQCPKAYQGNGHVDILLSNHILATGSLYGTHRLAFLAPPCGDIDSMIDFNDIDTYTSSIKSCVLDYLLRHHKHS